MTSRRLIAVLLSLLLTPVAAGAQVSDATPTQADFENADVFDVDLFSPTAPALVVLGVSPENAANTGVNKDYGFDVTNVGDGTKNRIGIAFSTTPFWWGHRPITLQEYRTQKSKAGRIGARTQMSLGLARAGGRSTESLTLGLGIQTQLLDAQDPKFDKQSYNCIHSAWQELRAPVFEQATTDLAGQIAKELENLGPEADTAEEINIDENSLFDSLGGDSEDQFLAARESCQDQAVARLLAKPSWMLGLGIGARSDPDQLTDFGYDGVTLWTTYRQPLDSQGRFAVFGFLRGDLDKNFDLGGDLHANGNALLAGLGGAYQTPKLRLDLSASFNHRDFDGSLLANDDFLRYSGVVDVRVRRGLWLEFSGGAVSQSAFNNGAFGSVNVKIAWGEYIPGL